jgi:hypothetical protein
MRAFFLSERLAILELIIPAVAVLAMVAAGSPRDLGLPRDAAGRQ